MSKFAHALRFLSIDAIEKSRSGHPGAPMGMAEMATVLWRRFLHHNPANPHFFNRDRFVLSNGHASMLLYSLLHLTGYDVSIDDLKQFRQLHSKTPGHPEHGYTPGVETTTGPLGQGFANAVGMALAEKILSATFNRPQLSIVDHYTYVFVGDGCLMEGISHEAASLAGVLGLGKLIVLYDDNHISIDGRTDAWFDENTPERFRAYGWQVIAPIDGHDEDAIAQALEEARANQQAPTLIACRTVIGKGAVHKADSAAVHGAPLGAEEVAATRHALAWPYAPFEIPDEIYAAWDAKPSGATLEKAWQALFAQYQQQYPELAAEFLRRMQGQLPADFAEKTAADLASIGQEAATIASRKASQNSITKLAQYLPELIGGSADLTPSNLTHWDGAQAVTKTTGGNYIHYGVREFGMAAIINGMQLHGGVRPFGATFLMFSEYARNALRMAALMKIPSIFVFTHDSIGLGEDGPTHQPVEQIATLRAIPNMHVWRPCDSVESFVAWQAALEETTTPSCLIFSRQNLPFVARDAATLKQIRRGGYVIAKAAESAQAVIIATGSEVALALEAQQQLAAEHIFVNVVSMPSTNVFDQQDAAWREQVLPAHLPKIAIEAASRDFWYKYTGSDGVIIGMDGFGESAPAADLFKHFGITTAALKDAIRQRLAQD